MKICVLTHCDLDGIGCAIVLGHLYGKDNINFTSLGYKNIVPYIQTFIEEGIYHNYDKVFITDLSFSKEDFDRIFPAGELPKNVIWVDHHETSKHAKNKKNVWWDDTKCGTSLLYKMVSKHRPKAVEGISKLVEVIEDYDLFFQKIPMSKDLNRLYFWMWGKKFYERFFNGDLEFNPAEISYVEKYKKMIKGIQEETEWHLFGDGKLCFATVPNHHHDVAEYIYEEANLVGSVILNQKLKALSVKGVKDYIRKNDLSIGDFCEKYAGGGHREVGGIGLDKLDWPDQMESLLKDFEEFMLIKDKTK